MNTIRLRVLLRFLIFLFSALCMCAASAIDAPRDPMAVISALADRIYVLGETTGNASEMVVAEVRASVEILQYIGSGATSGLIEKEKGRQSPLAAAAYMGYPNVASALLKSELVLAQQRCQRYWGNALDGDKYGNAASFGHLLPIDF